MKKSQTKSPKQPENQHHQQASSQPSHHSLLEYYRTKIDSLCGQRIQWLAKFQQCKFKLQQKHSLKEKLLSTRNEQRQINRNILHHEIALIDERLNVIKMQRENLIVDYRDAEEVIRIAELMQQYPKEIEKMLPCSNVNGSRAGQTINNDLNIHHSKSNKTLATRSSKQAPPNNFNIKHSLTQKSQKRNSASQSNLLPKNNNLSAGGITVQELLSRQIIELTENQQKQLSTMQQLKSRLQQLIRKTKEQQKQQLNQQREIVEQLNKEYKQLEKKHKMLAEEYFAGRRHQKQAHEDLLKQKDDLINKNKVLEDKVAKQMKVYEKENKAKQTLIIKKSQDFQENYRAKMRAKQSNLQALKQNYEKMQKICIEKVTKLQTALKKAKNKLKQAEERKQFLVEELRQQLHLLQKRVQQQKLERQQRQLKLRLKAEKEKLKQEEERQAKQREQAKAQRNRLIQQSYKRTVKIKQNRSRSKQRSKPKKQPYKGQVGKAPVPKKDIYGKPGQESEEDDSLEMDDLDNIRKQIGELENKIAADTR